MPGGKEGEPQPQPTPAANQAPIADAGADQAAGGGELVMLDGSGSSDPDGDALSFVWTQTGGLGVALSNPNAAMVSFIAPDADTLLTFQLMVMDGAGGSSTASTSVQVSALEAPEAEEEEEPEAVETRLYIANYNGHNVVSYLDPWTINGNIAPHTNLQGAQTKLEAPSDVVVNAAGQLLVSNFGTPSITTYDDAPATNGNLAPDGFVFGAATMLTDPTSIAISLEQDLLFVADITADVIYVYAGTSQSSFNGNLPPIRTIATTTSMDLQNPVGVNFGANDELYVANQGGQILVFASASSLNGDVTPSRIIESASFGALFDVFIDAHDTMYAVDPTGFIYIFNDASSLNGPVDPDFVLEVPPAMFLSAVAVDAEGTGYIVDAFAEAVYSYDGIHELNGAVQPDRVIQGANTQFDRPIRVFLSE